eukprot:363502-Chlamydomonas_euryale.AAC.3
MNGVARDGSRLQCGEHIQNHARFQAAEGLHLRPYRKNRTPPPPPPHTSVHKPYCTLIHTNDSHPLVNTRWFTPAARSSTQAILYIESHPSIHTRGTEPHTGHTVH